MEEDKVDATPNEQAANEQAANEQAANEQAANEQAANEQAANEQASNEQAANAQAAWLPGHKPISVPETSPTSTGKISTTNETTTTSEEQIAGRAALGLPRLTKRRTPSRKKKSKARGPGYGFFYDGSGASGSHNYAWERYNNDKHLKKNICKMRPTFSTQPKVSSSVRLKKRQRILEVVKAIPDPVSRAIRATSFLREKVAEIGATETTANSAEKKANIIGRIHAAVRHATNKWSVPRLELPRLWLEVVLPESDGSSRTRWDQFARVLKRECRNNIKAQELLAAYLERRCVSNEDMSGDEVGALWKVAILSGALHEDVVFGWHAGILGAVRIVAAIEMSAEKRAALRDKMQPFMKWLQRRDASVAAAPHHPHVQTAVVPALVLKNVTSVQKVGSAPTERLRPTPPLQPQQNATRRPGGRKKAGAKIKPNTAR